MDVTPRTFQTIDRAVPWEVLRQVIWLAHTVRGQGVNILGAKGSGKTYLLSRIVWQDYCQSRPQVVLDHVGPLIDGFLSKACEILPQLSAEQQRAWWDRIVLIDLAAETGDVVPFPTFYRLGTEDFYTIGQRPLDLFRQLDPELETAPITGLNALLRIGTHANTILAALGYQLTEAPHLLAHPMAWLSRLAEVENRFSETSASVSFLTQEFLQWSKDKQVTLSETFRTKVDLLTANPTMRAVFGASNPGVQWEEVIRKGHTVLIDARRILGMEQRRILMLWILKYFLSFIKYRGAGHHHPPIGLVIDELSLLTSLKSRGESILAEELNELINVYGRNNRVWLTTSAQELYQFTPTMQKMLLSMGTQIFSSTSDIDAAVTLARNLFDADSHRVKYWHPLYMMMDEIESAIPLGRSRMYIPKRPEIIDRRPEFQRLDEQHYEQAKRIKNQKTFHFFVRLAIAEGENDTKIYPMNIGFDHLGFANTAVTERARRILAKRSGTPREEILTEISSRSQGIPVPPPVARRAIQRDATMKGYEQHTYLPGTSSDTGTDDEPLVDYK
jgi:hypothetical protein